MNSKLIALVLAISGCASTIEPEDVADAVLADVMSTDATDAATDSQPDAVQPTRGAYVSCENSGGCPAALACNLGVCTTPCIGFDTSTCPTPPFGNQVVCAESRCLLACGGNLVCGNGTTCQRVGAYDVCGQ